MSISTTDTTFTIGKPTAIIKTITVIERHYDAEGNLVKEIETVTEYDNIAAPVDRLPAYPYYPYTIS